MKHTLKELLHLHSLECRVDTRRLRGKSRAWEFSHPRQDFMVKAYDAGYSYPRIARFLGLKCHSSVMHGVRSSRRRAAQREQFND